TMGCTASSDNGLFAAAADLPPDEVIFGNSPAMAAVRRKLEGAAGANIAILLRGQSGTGKEILAKLIHSRSPWAQGAFVKVNCPAIPGPLLESELFGYERGAFTGAFGVKRGRVELAHRGTLFLDEIAELDPTLQAKLLQLLQDGQFRRIGAHEDKKIQVRFVSATNRRLEREIESGNFREDLFYRINALTLELPLLRERRADIPYLVAYFLRNYSKQFACPLRPLSDRLLTDLQKYSWPGNIRELENLIKNYAIFGSEEDIRSAIQNGHQDFFHPEIPPSGVISLRKVTRAATKQLERKIILEVLETHRWNRQKAARALGISYSGLLFKMREAGVPPTRGPRAQREVMLDSGSRVN
ncbi:MAG TPA: sigma-54 dependent transcriptional regulator, partial [Candidatus Acidoferrales bacterium]|nr:sigma-54 dependent transcriptional regulator [Candidatus Acidoferrales bacterium]